MKELSTAHSQLDAANAHCTIAQQEATDVWIQLENHKRKHSHKSTKVKSQFVMHPDLKALFEQEKIEQEEKERVEAEKQAQKNAEQTARNACITEDMVSRTFDKLTCNQRQNGVR
jgi:hypothetical protein